MTTPKSHLKRVQISGFKSIASLDLIMNPINILIGANGSGKSNFISLFSFLRHLSEGKLQTYVEQHGFANTFFHFGAKKTKTISITLDVGENTYHADFLHGEANDALVFAQEYCNYIGSPRDFHIKGKLGESGLLPGGEADSEYVKKYTREYLNKCRVYHFHDTSASAAFKQAQSISASTFLQNDAANLAPYLYYLKEYWPENYQEIVAAIQTVAPFFHDFYLVPQGTAGNEVILLRWTHKDHDAPFSANQLSDGTARFICLSTLFLQPEYLRPSTIVLDEPELGLHPAALEVLAEIIQVTAKTSQVICSTQSVTFANFFKPQDFIVVDQKKGVSTFERLEEDQLQIWLEDYGMGDIWMKNLVGGRPEW